MTNDLNRLAGLSELECRAFSAANFERSVSEYQQLVKDLWAAYCGMERRADQAAAQRKEWQPIETAPRCVASSPTDNGKRPVLVTRWPITGAMPPVAIARLTRDGWINGPKGRRLYFEPTHWAPLYENVPSFPPHPPKHKS